MSDKPERIFLSKLTHFDMLCSVWGKKRVRDTDTEYIRADLAKPSEGVKRFENVNDAVFTESELAKQITELQDHKRLSQGKLKLQAARIKELEQAKPSEWISVDDPPVYVLGFSVARKGWCVFTEDIEGVTMEYWAGPFSEQCVAESEIKRLEERTP